VDVKTNSLTKTREAAEITAAADEVQPLIDKAYEDFRAQADIKGFRKGKAPLSIVKKMYGETIESEAITDIVNQLYNRAIAEKNLQPVGDPVLKDVNYKPEESFIFTVEYEVVPEITLQDYKKIPVEKPVQQVTDDMIRRELEGIRLNHAARSETDAVADAFHTLTVDIQELDDQGVAIIGKRSQDQTIDLFDERYEKDFIEPLKHAEKGGDYVVKFDHDHGEHRHSVHVKITVKKIEKLELPDIDDDFVKKHFKDKFQTADELREDIRSQLQNMFDEESTRTVRNKIADEIVKRHDFPVPEALIAKVFDQMLEDVKTRMPEQKLPGDFDRHAFEGEYYQQAEWQAKWSILREKLFEAEKIDVDDADIEKRAEKDAAQFRLAREQVLGFYKTNDQIRDRIMHDKLMENLESYAAVTETAVPTGTEEREPSRIIQ
jgi:trigger factor